MNTKQILFLFCIKIYQLSATSHDKSLRIIGGRDAVPGEFPYVLKMEQKMEKKDGVFFYFHVCTCSLFKPTWSLTAAHCILSIEEGTTMSPPVKGVIRHNLSSDHESSFRNILSMFKEPNYRRYKYENDIGLILSETIHVSSFAKLSSVDYVTLYGSKVLTLGYGLTIGSNETYGDAHSVNKPLQVLDAVIIKCSVGGIWPAFCLGGICGLWPASRPGDSGGPVLHVSGVVGVCAGSDSSKAITSNQKKKSLKNKINLKRKNIAAFTPASGYIDWITNVINSISS